MSTALGTIFGTEITVGFNPRDIQRQYAGFPGGHGLTAMHLGSRGHPLFIRGRLRASGGSYSEARSALGTAISAIEDYLFVGIDDYTWMGNIFYAVLFDKFELLGDSKGKYFRWTKEGYCVCDFIMIGRSIL